MHQYTRTTLIYEITFFDVLILISIFFKKTEFSAYAKFYENPLKAYFLMRSGGCRRARYFITAHDNYIRGKDFLLQSIFWTNAIHDFMHFKEMPVFELMYSKKYWVRKKFLKKLNNSRYKFRWVSENWRWQWFKFLSGHKRLDIGVR